MCDVVDYTIKAYPTVYNGRQYRSRLEARWAAFFDLCGWTHEYEPYDLGGWSPDFLLYTSEKSYLVEVKPIGDFDQEIADEMYNATEKKVFQPPYGGILLVGTAPVLIELKYGKAARIGHCNCTNFLPDAWSPYFKTWAFGSDSPDVILSCITSQSELEACNGDVPYPAHTMRLWVKASNMVQYMRPETVA